MARKKNEEKTANGYWVRYNAVPTSVVQSVVTMINRKATFGQDGALRTDGLPFQAQLDLLSTMDKVYMHLLVKRAVELADGLPADTSWMDDIVMDPSIIDTFPSVDFNNTRHQELLFLRYVALSSDELENLMNRVVGDDEEEEAADVEKSAPDKA